MFTFLPNSDLSTINIFTNENYQEAYRKDLLSATKHIVISSPAISGAKIHELISLLTEQQQKGVTVTVVTWAPDAYDYGDAAYWMQLHEEMRQAGFYIRLVEEFCVHFAIIDSEMVWYGNMNLLGKERAEDSMMRVESKRIAEELMGMVC